MENVSRNHYAQWLKDAENNKSPKSIMMTARTLNMETSLTVFCGQHIPPEAIVEISEKYWLITKALQLVNFPLNVPGTNVYNACKARKVAMKWLEAAAAKSKEHIIQGGEVECMLDAWVVEINAAKEKTGKEFSDREMAMVIFSFLFASQDAMSSGIIFLFQHLADRPDMLAKVREEQIRVRGDRNTRMTLEMLDEMTYLKAFVKESLRVVPPVTMVIGIAATFAATTHRAVNRFLTKPKSPSLSPLAILYRQEVWSFLQSILHFMIPRSFPNLKN